MMKEPRLIGLATIDQINKRRVKAGATVLAKRENARSTSRSGDVPFQEQRLSVLNNADQGLTTTFTPDRNEFGVQTGAGTTGAVLPGQSPNPKPGGVLDQKATERLTGAGMTPEQAAQRIRSLRPSIAGTMSSTGLNNDPVARANANAAADRKARSADAKGYVKQTTVNEDGSTTETMVEDPNATRQAQQDKENALANADAAAANVAAANKEANPTPVPTPESFAQNLPAESQQQGVDAYAPLLKQLQGDLDGMKGGLDSSVESINRMHQETMDFVAKQQARDDMLFGYFKAQNQEALDRRMDVARDNYDANMRATDLAHERRRELSERAVRDQMIKNEEDRKAQLLGLGVSGAWRSSRHTASVISALQKGERMLADMRSDAAFAERQYGLDVRQVTSAYHAAVTEAYDGYASRNSQLYEKMMDRARDIDRTVFESTQKKKEAIRDAQSAYVKGVGDLAKEYNQTLIDRQKQLWQVQKDARDFRFRAYQQNYDEAMKYIDAFGTANKAQLAYYEELLGYEPGSLSNQRTLEEIRARKGAGGSGGGLDMNTMLGFAQSRMDQYRRAHPEKSVQDIATMVLRDYNFAYGGSAKGKKAVDGMAQWLSMTYGGGGSYVVPTLDAGTLGGSQQHGSDPSFTLSPAEILGSKSGGGDDDYGSAADF